MYKIIGADQKEYGPITADQITAWISEGRANAQTKVQPVGTTGWIALGELREFAGALGIPAASEDAPPPTFAAAESGPPKTSGMAIASLVLGILGFCGITALVGGVLGIIALVSINRSQGRLKGSGMAIAGICLSVLTLVLAAVMVAMMVPAVSKAKTRAQTIMCVNNAKQLALAVKIYAGDHDGQFPPAATWCDAIHDEAGNDFIYRCPVAMTVGGSKERSNFAFNSKLSGLNETNVSPDTVMIFETAGGWNVSGGPELMLSQPRHNGQIVVALADGSVREMTEAEARNLRWEP